MTEETKEGSLPKNTDSSKPLAPNAEVLSREELLAHVQAYLPEAKRGTIGLVGYPNVGKSSIINVLCKKKRVGVAPKPGKTKHL